MDYETQWTTSSRNDLLLTKVMSYSRFFNFIKPLSVLHCYFCCCVFFTHHSNAPGLHLEPFSYFMLSILKWSMSLLCFSYHLYTNEYLKLYLVVYLFTELQIEIQKASQRSPLGLFIGISGIYPVNKARNLTHPLFLFSLIVLSRNHVYSISQLHLLSTLSLLSTY